MHNNISFGIAKHTPAYSIYIYIFGFNRLYYIFIIFSIILYDTTNSLLYVKKITSFKSTKKYVNVHVQHFFLTGEVRYCISSSVYKQILI